MVLFSLKTCYFFIVQGHRNSMTIWERICKLKKPVIEPKDSSLFPAAMQVSNRCLRSTFVCFQKAEYDYLIVSCIFFHGRTFQKNCKTDQLRVRYFLPFVVERYVFFNQYEMCFFVIKDILSIHSVCMRILATSFSCVVSFQYGWSLLCCQVSEGLDFADGAGRAVVITGLPYARVTDPRVCLLYPYVLFSKCI